MAICSYVNASSSCPEVALPGKTRCDQHQRPAWSNGGGNPRTSTPQWKALSAAIIERDAGVCGICGKPGADQADHIIPVAEGGTDHPPNLQAVHEVPCHRRKTAAEGGRGKARRR